MYNTPLETAFSRELETRFNKRNTSGNISNSNYLQYITNQNCDNGTLSSDLSFYNEYDILEIL